MKAVKEVIVSSVIGKPATFSHTPRRSHASALTGGIRRARRFSSVMADSRAALLQPSPYIRGGLSPRALRRVHDYVDAHLGEKFDNAMLAAIAGVSTSHFVRAFRQSEGLSPRRYVIRRRVERTKELLAGTNLRLAEIATTVGFADQSHCARFFREQVGVGPRDYRWATR
jgi:AraC family transcriptional regulator